MHKRKPESERIYQDALKNGRTANFVAEEPIEEFDFWKIIHNNFPYDAISRKHHMLVPKRKVGSDTDLTIGELNEFTRIKKQIADKYDIFLENSDHDKSVREHWHLHLIQWIK